VSISKGNAKFPVKHVSRRLVPGSDPGDHVRPVVDEVALQSGFDWNFFRFTLSPSLTRRLAMELFSPTYKTFTCKIQTWLGSEIQEISD
jgi:hypothetical protein